MSQKEEPPVTVPRRNLLCAAISLAACSFLTECGFTANSNHPSDPAEPPPNPAELVPLTLTLTTKIIGEIADGFIGLSYEKTAMSYSYFHESNHNLIALFRLLGKGVLRIGGGSVDKVAFVDTSKGTHLQVTPANIAALGAFLKQTGWQCIYGLNFATSTPALAAREALQVCAALGGSLLGIEIGNEPDEYSITGHFFVGEWTFEEFMHRWSLFREAILEAVPSAPFTGPASGGGNHITSWTLPFGQVVGSSQIALLTQHYYRASGHSPVATADFLISADPQLASDLALLDAGASALGIPYRLSECNSFYSGGAPGVSNSYASSLWVIDFLFTAAANRATGVNLHGGGNQPGYTPIADDSGGVIEARPEYYGLLFFSLAGLGTLLETHFVTPRANVTAYTVGTPSGGVNVVIVNKNSTGDLPITIEAFRPIQKANAQILSGPGLDALSGVTIQGSTVTQQGIFTPASAESLIVTGRQTTCIVPALSAALICIT